MGWTAGRQAVVFTGGRPVAEVRQLIFHHDVCRWNDAGSAGPQSQGRLNQSVEWFFFHHAWCATSTFIAWRFWLGQGPALRYV